MNDTFRNLVFGVLLAIMVGWLLVIGRGVLLPIVAGLLVAYIVLGLADLVGKLPVVGARVPAPLRHAVSIVVIAGALFWMVSLFVSNIGQIIALAPQLQGRLLVLIQEAAIRLGLETEPTWETLRNDVIGQVNLQRAFGRAFASVSAIVATFSIVSIYAGFLLVERRAFTQKLRRLSDDPVRVERIRNVIDDMNGRIGTYLVMKTFINAMLGVLSYAILRFFGVEFAGFWAILIGLFNYIPYVGGIIGVFFPVALSILQFTTPGPILALLTGLTAAQILVGNFIEPWLMGNSLNLSPFVIMVSLVVWTTLWGVAGAILSVPIMAILVIVLSEFQGTRWIAVLLSLDGNVASSARR